MPAIANPPAAANARPAHSQGLTARLGSPAVLQASTNRDEDAARVPASTRELKVFLEDYRDRILLGQEVPMILRAYDLARRGHWRDLIALDLEWGRTAHARSFAEASRHVGRRQLSQLRPLRDQRLIQRYAEAVECGKAQGWHVIVYAIALATFSIPLRTGLLHYAQQTLGGFLDSAPTSHRLTDADKAAVSEDIHHPLATLLLAALPPPPAFGAV